jgi:hypothetical protein
LFTAGTSVALASSRSAQDMDNTSRTITDNSSGPRDGSGDVADLTSRTSAPHGKVHDAAGASTDNNNDRSTGGAAPAPARQPHLGWQSLLPGSIQ